MSRRLILAATLLLALLPALVLPRSPHATAAGVTAHVTSPALAGPSARPSLVGPKAYYLSLGDSLAWGKQPNGDNSQGYSDDFYADLSSQGTSSLINMGCPSETSTTFVQGGCPYANLVKYPYTGPQLAAAVTFIQQHPGQVSPVTLDLGINDMTPLFDAATCTMASTQAISQALSTYDSNLDTIFSQLQAALGGSGDLIVMTNYFAHQNQCPNLVPLAQQFNSHLTADAQAYSVPVAPVFDAFGGASTPNPNLCSYTWICSSYQDIHPTTQGYSVIAATVEATANYTGTTPASPTLTLSRSSGRYKDTVTITGTNFGASEPISLSLDSSATPPLTTTTSAADGSFVTTFITPQAISGTHTLLAVGQSSGLTATAPFVILPGAYLAHYQGNKGTTDVLKGAGFAPYEHVTGSWNATSGVPFTLTATTNGIGTFGGSADYPGITFTVPLSPTGTYLVYAVGQSSGGVAHATFTLRPHLQVLPASGPAGSAVTLVGTGYGANESVPLKYNCGTPTCTSTTVLATPQTDGNGSFSVAATIPTSTHAGQHSIGGKGSTSGVFASTSFTVQ